MGGKGSTPAPPDYTGAATTQANASKENINTQNFANRPTINTPWGTQSWDTSATTDPATGQAVTSWTQNTTLAPALQQALDSQVGLQQGRSDLAGGFMQRVSDAYGQPFNWNSMPQLTTAGQPGQVQGSTTDYTPGLQSNVQSNSGNLMNGFSFGGPQMGVGNMMGGMSYGTGQTGIQGQLNTSGNPALPQFDSGYRDQVANSLMQRMVPVQERQQSQLDTRLANQGFTQGSQAYKQALDELGQRQSAERYNALDTAGNEAQRLYNMQMGTAQQAFNQSVTGGQFANQAAGQQFQQGLAANQFQNQAVNQAYNQNLGAANFGNQAQQQYYNQMMGQANLNNSANQQGFNQNLQSSQFNNAALGQANSMDQSRQNSYNQGLQQQQGMNQSYAAQMNQARQQAIAEQMQQRGMSLNEMNALLSGQQVGMPQMPSFNSSNVSQTPDLMGAMNNNYNAQMQAYNAQQQGSANLFGGLTGLASTAMMFSDKRLKRRIRRVGTHPLGVGIYDYEMFGYPQTGVLAQELQKVRPDLVERHASGFLMVNYGAL